MTDYLTPTGAAELAKRINAYWSARGIQANARVEAETLSQVTSIKNGRTVAVVRSDLMEAR